MAHETRRIDFDRAYANPADVEEWVMAKAANPTKRVHSPRRSAPAKLPHHPLIKQIQEHETKPQSGAVLVGYPGPSPRPGYVRLYLQLGLRAMSRSPRTASSTMLPSSPTTRRAR